MTAGVRSHVSAYMFVLVQYKSVCVCFCESRGEEEKMTDIKEETEYLGEIKLSNCKVLMRSVECNNPVKVQVVVD